MSEVDVVLGGVANGDGDRQPDGDRDGIMAVVRFDDGWAASSMDTPSRAGHPL